jgi:hypothetical protein
MAEGLRRKAQGKRIIMVDIKDRDKTPWFSPICFQQGSQDVPKLNPEPRTQNL